MKRRHWMISAGLFLMSIIFLAASHGCAKDRHERGELPDSGVTTVGEATISIEERSQSLQTAVEGHREPSASMVYMSWFPDSRDEMFVDIHPDGNGGKGILKDGKATFKQEPISLTPAQVKEIQGLLDHLPPSASNVPQDLAVLVSYHQGDLWQTKGYNRYDLPPEILRIYQLSDASITTTRPSGPP